MYTSSIDDILTEADLPPKDLSAEASTSSIPSPSSNRSPSSTDDPPFNDEPIHSSSNESSRDQPPSNNSQRSPIPDPAPNSTPPSTSSDPSPDQVPAASPLETPQDSQKEERPSLPEKTILFLLGRVIHWQSLNEEDLLTIKAIACCVQERVEGKEWLGRAAARLEELVSEAVVAMEMAQSSETSEGEKASGAGGSESAEEGAVTGESGTEQERRAREEVAKEEVVKDASGHGEKEEESVEQEQGQEHEQDDLVQVIPRGAFSFAACLCPRTDAPFAVGTESFCLRLPRSATFATLLDEVQRRDPSHRYDDARCEVGGRILHLDTSLGNEVERDQQLPIKIHRLRGGADDSPMDLELDFVLNLEDDSRLPAGPVASGSGLARDAIPSAQDAAPPNAAQPSPHPEPPPAQAGTSAAAEVKIEAKEAEEEEEEGPAVRVESSRLVLTYEEFDEKLGAQIRLIDTYRAVLRDPTAVSSAALSALDSLTSPPEPLLEASTSEEPNVTILDPSEDAMHYAIWRSLDTEIKDACRQPAQGATAVEEEAWRNRLDVVERMVKAVQRLLQAEEFTPDKDELEKGREAWKERWEPKFREEVEKAKAAIEIGRGKGKGRATEGGKEKAGVEVPERLIP